MRKDFNPKYGSEVEKEILHMPLVGRQRFITRVMRFSGESRPGYPHWSKKKWLEIVRKEGWLGVFMGRIAVRAPIHRLELLWFEFSTQTKGQRMGLSYRFDQMWGRRKKELGLKRYQ